MQLRDQYRSDDVAETKTPEVEAAGPAAEDSPEVVEAQAAAQAGSIMDTFEHRRQEQLLRTFVEEGQIVPYNGVWFQIKKIDGPYVVMQASDFTSKMKRRMRG